MGIIASLVHGCCNSHDCSRNSTSTERNQYVVDIAASLNGDLGLGSFLPVRYRVDSISRGIEYVFPTNHPKACEHQLVSAACIVSLATDREYRPSARFGIYCSAMTLATRCWQLCMTFICLANYAWTAVLSVERNVRTVMRRHGPAALINLISSASLPAGRFELCQLWSRVLVMMINWARPVQSLSSSRVAPQQPSSSWPAPYPQQGL